MDDRGLATGDRALFQGIGQLRGKHCDVLSVRRDLVTLRFDSGASVIALVRDCHPIPRRPPPMF